MKIGFKSNFPLLQGNYIACVPMCVRIYVAVCVRFQVQDAANDMAILPVVPA